MPHRLKRSELYDLVWSEPMRTLAARFGVSDVALGKACRKADIPLPGLGYWAKRQAGKQTTQIALPPRGIGMSDEVFVGGNRYSWNPGPTDREILGPVPPPPAFEEAVDDLRKRIQPLVGTVRVSKTHTHPLIANLLAEDERRRERQRASSYSFPWDAPLFETPLQRRRLRILNSLFLALARAGAKPSLRGKETLELGVLVGEQHVGFTLEGPAVRPQPHRGRAHPKLKESELRLEIKSTRYDEGTRAAWQDSDADTVESHLTAIVVELLVAGELQYREACEWSYKWRLERRTQLQEEERKRNEEAERKERERLVQLEKARIDRLLGEAAALKQANDIRTYVSAVEKANASSPDPLSAAKLGTWAKWARDQADRLDPIATGRFRKGVEDGEPKVAP
ncbi:hypothetical protein VB618_11060 [Microvirga sp. CF3062]|uniref:hypothetical protein n=1 Tax=Microvirga sp. CF3062 TaxID=3110182 RepID=UPI002E7AA694|nr:hypothetical protein [Microvirga sp. CF3062]MEE1656738.1 hypothetical protein [Microvirga sp. CF3062]